MGYHISRQRDFKSNCLFVEIAVGGKTKAGPDVLTARYPQEQKTYIDPRDTINIAEAIFQKWDRDYADEIKKLRIVGIENPLTYDFTPKGIAAAKMWADRIFANMSKCNACGKPMGNREPYNHNDLVNKTFCSEYCCSNKYRDVYGVEPAKITTGHKKLKIGKI